MSFAPPSCHVPAPDRRSPCGDCSECSSGYCLALTEEADSGVCFDYLEDAPSTDGTGQWGLVRHGRVEDWVAF